MCRFEYLGTRPENQSPRFGLRILKIIEPLRVVQSHFAGRQVLSPPVEGQLLTKPFKQGRVWTLQARRPGIFRTWMEQQKSMSSS